MKFYILLIITIIVLTACAPTQNTFSEEESRQIAEEFVLNSPTYQFDGANLQLVETYPTDCIKSCWSFDFTFTSSHGGYGDRTGQILTQVAQTHTARIYVEEGVVKGASLDGKWDMLVQAEYGAEGSGSGSPRTCNKDMKLCDDGTQLVREPYYNCEFVECADGSTGSIEVFVLESPCGELPQDFECDTPEDIHCVNDRDNSGWQCIHIGDVESVSPEQSEITWCSPQQKEAVACTMEYMPVCGYRQVQCIKAPCDPIEVGTFGNSCTACADKNVDLYVQGECPSRGVAPSPSI